MPAITVRIYDGRTPEQKAQFVEAVTQLSIDLLDARPGRTAVRFESLGPRPDKPS